MSRLISKLMHVREALKTFGTRHRVTLFALALIVFLVGLYVSFENLDLTLSTLSLGPVILIVLLTQPLMIFINSLELKLCAQASQSSLSLQDSVYVSSSATIANILPLPAGLVLRAGALIKYGGKISVVSKVLLIAALMWVAIAVTVSGALIADGYFSAFVLMAGIAAISILVLYTLRLCNLKIALGFLAVRAALVAVLVVQLKLWFAVIGSDIALSDAAIYVVSGVAGAVISIVPAGLGVIESFGALLAKLDGASTSLAFIVLSLNRLGGLALAAISIMIFGAFRRVQHEPSAL